MADADSHVPVSAPNTLDRGAMHLKEELMPRYAELVYFGYWFSPEREMLQSLIDKSQENVTGVVRLKLYKGSVSVVGRKSPQSLYSMQHVTFEADSVYNQRDAEGFIKLNALRLRLRHQGTKYPTLCPMVFCEVMFINRLICLRIKI